MAFGVASTPPPLPLTLTGATLASALMGQSYSQSVFGFASGGTAPLTFSQSADVGPGVFVTSGGGLVTGTPTVSSIQIMNDGTYIIDENGNIMVT